MEKGFIRTQRYYTSNRQEIFKTANVRLKKLFDKISVKSEIISDACPSTRIFDQTICRNPSISEQVKYFYKIFFRDLAKFIERFILKRRHNWQIGYQLNSWKGANLRQSKFIIPQKGHFCTDPFIYDKDGRTCIFYEDYSYADGKGVISCSEVSAEGEIRRLRILNWKLSVFPLYLNLKSNYTWSLKLEIVETCNCLDAIDFDKWSN